MNNSRPTRIGVRSYPEHWDIDEEDEECYADGQAIVLEDYENREVEYQEVEAMYTEEKDE